MGEKFLADLALAFSVSLLKAHQHPHPMSSISFTTAGVISWPRTVCVPASGTPGLSGGRYPVAISFVSLEPSRKHDLDSAEFSR